MDNEILFPNKGNISRGFEWFYENLEQQEIGSLKQARINFFNLSIPKEYNIDMARLKALYNCEVVGISNERDSVLNSIINTGFFIKENKTPKEYYQTFRRLLELTDFSLMILDNTYYNSENLSKKRVPFTIVNPLYFENNYFYYQKLKVGFVQPKQLEQAMSSGKDVWQQESIHVYSLAEPHSGFRFATTSEERDYLDFYTEILSNRIGGF